MPRIATLIVNPAAGRAAILHAQMPSITQLLASHGYIAQVLQTTPDPDSGRDLARQSAGAALILACGGDGTVHDVLQGLAHTGTALGVLPLGTANALARNLRLPLDPLAALTCLLTYTPRTIPLGEITTSRGRRLFTVVAGCGPDGALAHSMPAGLKRRLGRGAYYAHAARLFATRRWPMFRVDYRLPNDENWNATEAFAITCSRVPSLGGLFSGLTQRAQLSDPWLHVQLLRAPAPLSLAAWFGLRYRSPWLTTLDVTELRCTPLTATPVHAQVDAEPFGELPLHLRVVPAALNLLMPA